MTILGSGGRESPLSTAGAVPQWSGREVRALREARRMSVRQFAAHLGVSDRMVSKWEAGGLAIRPRPVNQAALDTSLAQASPEMRARFGVLCGAWSPRLVRQRAEHGEASLSHLVRHPEDGKLMTLVESGPWLRGQPDEAHWLSGFYLDVFPTTCADYGRFLAATGHPAPAYWGGDEAPERLLHHPVVEVCVADARAYAAWAAKPLPTSCEWEKAARGPSGGTYPWGEQAGAAWANVRESRVGATTPVDRYDNGGSPYGIYDMCGNVAEWCGSAVDGWVVRGGGYQAALHAARPAARVELPPETRRPDVGFRCALAVEAMLEILSI